jgi:hypothetical protein
MRNYSRNFLFEAALKARAVERGNTSVSCVYGNEQPIKDKRKKPPATRKMAELLCNCSLLFLLQRNFRKRAKSPNLR